MQKQKRRKKVDVAAGLTAAQNAIDVRTDLDVDGMLVDFGGDMPLHSTCFKCKNSNGKGSCIVIVFLVLLTILRSHLI